MSIARLRDNPVDAAAIDALCQIRGLVRLGRHPLRVLDGEPVEIHHVQGAIGSHGKIHRTKPAVGRGKELDALPAWP